MSFLDNLENNLKALEGREERDPGAERAKREQERSAAMSIAPWATQLRDSQYVQKLLGLAARAGIQRRTKIVPTWLDTTLRLSWKGERLELRPIKGGIDSVSLDLSGEELARQPLDLSSDPAELLSQWLTGVESRLPVFPVETPE